jgi:hypothetical protein
MDDFFSEEYRKKHFENELILRKSLLNGSSSKVAKDNIKLRQNLRSMAKNFLRQFNDKNNSSQIN